jgi:hypothetical protein
VFTDFFFDFSALKGVNHINLSKLGKKKTPKNATDKVL